MAKAVVRTPYRFAADISDSARPVAIDGSRELIERGYHRPGGSGFVIELAVPETEWVEELT